MSKKIELNIKTENGYEVLYPKGISSENYTAIITTVWDDETIGYSQEISVIGLKETDEPIISPILTDSIEDNLKILSNWSALAGSGRIISETDKIKVFAYDSKPEIELPIMIKVVN